MLLMTCGVRSGAGRVGAAGRSSRTPGGAAPGTHAWSARGCGAHARRCATERCATPRRHSRSPGSGCHRRWSRARRRVPSLGSRPGRWRGRWRPGGTPSTLPTAAGRAPPRPAGRLRSPWGMGGQARALARAARRPRLRARGGSKRCCGWVDRSRRRRTVQLNPIGVGNSQRRSWRRTERRTRLRAPPRAWSPRAPHSRRCSALEQWTLLAACAQRAPAQGCRG